MLSSRVRDGERGRRDNERRDQRASSLRRCCVEGLGQPPSAIVPNDEVTHLTLSAKNHEVTGLKTGVLRAKG